VFHFLLLPGAKSQEKLSLGFLSMSDRSVYKVEVGDRSRGQLLNTPPPGSGPVTFSSWTPNLKYGLDMWQQFLKYLFTWVTVKYDTTVGVVDVWLIHVSALWILRIIYERTRVIVSEYYYTLNYPKLQFSIPCSKSVLAKSILQYLTNNKSSKRAKIIFLGSFSTTVNLRHNL